MMNVQREAAPTPAEQLQDILDLQPLNGPAAGEQVRWPRNDQVRIFRQLADEKGFRSTHRIGWTSSLDTRTLTDPQAVKLLGKVKMRFPRLIMRWRKDQDNNTYLRLALILDQAHVTLPDWPEISVYFAYGLSKGDPTLVAPVGDGLKHFYHGSPHVVHQGFKVPRFKDDRVGEMVPRAEVARIDNHDQYFATYFWVDFREPDLWTIENLRVAVDAMLELAGTYTDAMYASVQPGADLHQKVVEQACRGAAKAIKTTVKKRRCRGSLFQIPVDYTETVRRILEHSPDEVTPAIQRAAAWAIRKDNIKVLSRIRKLNVALGKHEARKYGTVVRALITLRLAAELEGKPAEDCGDEVEE